MTIYIIKIIACVTMLIDHIKYAIPETTNFITMYFGRISFPLFAFLLTEGYIHTSNLKRYYKRLIIFAIISQIPFMLFRTLVSEDKMLNIMFTLLLGLITITIYDKEKRKYISIPAILLIIYLGKKINVDYGWFGIATIFILYLFKDKKVILSIAYGILLLLYFYYNEILVFNKAIICYYIFYLIPIIFIMMYNGKLGKKTKYFYYTFYPVHMLILYLISFV